MVGLLKDVSVVIAEGKRPVSFRTRKLSPPAPMVLPPGGGGRVGRRRTQREEMAHDQGWAFFVSSAQLRFWPASRICTRSVAASSSERLGNIARARLPWSAHPQT